MSYLICLEQLESTRKMKRRCKNYDEALKELQYLKELSKRLKSSKCVLSIKDSKDNTLYAIRTDAWE